MLNLALVPLKTNESERSLCLASANASSELQKDLKRLSNFDTLSDEVEDLPTLYSVDLLNLDTCRNDLLLEDIRQYGRKI